ncbi:MAG: TlpA family protein disulfide reductase [Chloroflexi bacterium]|nr:TlpA family protein disulfide reductase [Chloroflexota bacterium]
MSSAAEHPEVAPRTEAVRRRRLVIAAWLVAGVAALVVFLTVNVGRPAGPVDTPIVGRPAPAFDLDTLAGGRLSLAQLRGSAVVLNFWASWCIPCREEAPLLTAADATYGPRGVRVIGVVYQDSADNARDFMRRYGQTYPGLLDPSGRTAIDYGVFGIPETFFIDASGVVRSRQVGALTADDRRRQIEAIVP